MIGDWVNVVTTVDFPKIDKYGIECTKTIQVKEILDGKIRCSDGELYEKVSPVFLNEEILRRNGFTYDLDRKTFTMGLLFQLKKCSGGFDLQKSLPCRTIDTVSTLQHVLRLCHMEELANNFKI